MNLVRGGQRPILENSLRNPGGHVERILLVAGACRR